MPRFRPKVFIASSSKALPVATAVQASLVTQADQLEKYAGVDAEPWPTTFSLGQSAFHELLAASRRFEFGVFVFAPDDRVISGDSSTNAPRDNVIYELGLFTGALGPDHVFVLRPKGVDVKVPSDLAGITLADYPPPESARRQDSRALANAVRPACADILTDIADVLEREVLVRQEEVHSFHGADMLATQVFANLHRGELDPIDSETKLSPGLLVVHMTLGLGTVLSWDRPFSPDSIVRVRFGPGAGIVLVRELFLTTRRLS